MFIISNVFVNDMSENDENPTRRSVVKRVATAGAVAGVGTGTAAASTGQRPGIQTADVSVESARRAFAAKAAETLELLSARGVLEAGDVSELPSAGGALSDVLSGDEGVAAGTVETPGSTPDEELIVASVETGDQLVRVFVNETAGVSYATVTTNGSVTLVDPTSDEPFRADEIDQPGDGGCSGYCSRSSCFLGELYIYRTTVDGSCVSYNTQCGC